MKKWLVLGALVISTHSFAHTEATTALLSVLNGTYYGHDCKVIVTQKGTGVSVEMFKNNDYMEYFVVEGSGFQYRPYGRFISSYRDRHSSVDYTEYGFLTTPTNFGQYAVIEKRVVKNRRSEVTKIECEIID